MMMVVSVPAAWLGAEGAGLLTGVDPVWLRGAYAGLMLGLCAFLTLSPRPEALLEEECVIPEGGDENDFSFRSKTIADGTTTYTYLKPIITPGSVVATVG